MAWVACLLCVQAWRQLARGTHACFLCVLVCAVAKCPVLVCCCFASIFLSIGFVGRFGAFVFLGCLRFLTSCCEIDFTLNNQLGGCLAGIVKFGDSLAGRSGTVLRRRLSDFGCRWHGVEEMR